jgi:MYXO-CTERM domain-containing protein
LLSAALTALAVLVPGSRAHAFCQTTTKTKLTGSECITDGIPLRWKRQCITFTVASTDPAVRDAVDRSFATWTEVDCGGQPIGLALRQTEETAICTLAEYNADAPNMNAILFVQDWSEHAELPADAFAVTLVWNLKQDGEIVDADMLLNPTLGNLTICGGNCGDPENDIDIQNVVTHEAGHFLGLAHTDVEGATMSPTAPVGQVEKRDLAADDVDGLCAIYGDFPVTACTNKDFVPRHGFSVDCRQPPSSNHGCAVGAAGGKSARSSERSERSDTRAWLAALALGAGLLVRRRRR